MALNIMKMKKKFMKENLKTVKDVMVLVNAL